MAEPVMPEKIREMSTFTWAVPPFIRPNRPLQKLNILSVISDSLSTLAMNTNSGAASMVKPAIILPVITVYSEFRRLGLATRKYTMGATIMENEMGIRMTKQTANVTNRTRTPQFIRSPPYCPTSWIPCTRLWLF